MSNKNFYELSHGPVSDAVNAVAPDALVPIGAISDHLEKVHPVLRGVSSILKIVRAHNLAKNRDPSETGPMLDGATIDELAAFGQVAVEMMAQEVEETAELIERCARAPGDAFRRAYYAKQSIGSEHE